MTTKILKKAIYFSERIIRNCPSLKRWKNEYEQEIPDLFKISITAKINLLYKKYHYVGCAKFQYSIPKTPVLLNKFTPYTRS